VSSSQRRRVRQAILDGHLAFVAEVFGSTAIDKEDYDRLRAAGKIRDERLMPEDAAAAGHAIGAMTGHAIVDASSASGVRADDPRPLLADPAAFWRHLRSDPQVVTEVEREAVALLRARVAQHVRGLGDKLDAAVGRILVAAADDDRRRRLVSPGAEGPPGGHDVVVSRIRDEATALRRDWLRIAHTELHNAVEEAKAAVLATRSRPRDPRVFKRPHHDACAFCRTLYLRPDGVTPRVFKLSALLGNGSNVGRRAGRPSRTEWKAVVGAAHPHCQCELFALAAGMGFDAGGHMVYVGAKKSLSIEVELADNASLHHVCEER